jgi:hypothetical protein
MRQLAFILFRRPIEFVGPNRLELVELGIKNSEVQVMPEINPSADEEGEIGANEGMIEVVEGF